MTQREIARKNLRQMTLYSARPGMIEEFFELIGAVVNREHEKENFTAEQFDALGKVTVEFFIKVNEIVTTHPSGMAS